MYWRGMKKSRQGILLYLGVIIFTLLVGLVVLLAGRNWNGQADLRIGIVDNNGLRIINISPERRMINVLKVSGEDEIWIPEGLGWYRADKVRGVLAQENKKGLLKKVFFYNFGFNPDRIWDENDAENWMDGNNIIKQMGIGNYLVFEKQSWSMVVNETDIKGNLDSELTLLQNVIPRDFSDREQTIQESRIGVYNSSQEDKLASFLADRIEWAGLNVTTVENSMENIDKCLVVTKDFKTVSKATMGLIRQIFECQEKTDPEVNDNEIDLYFGEGYVSMLKYNNYVRSF